MRMSARFPYSTGHGKCSVLFAFFLFFPPEKNAYPSVEVQKLMHAHPSLADAFEVRLMKSNGASDLV